jgi:hypothetical protein
LLVCSQGETDERQGDGLFVVAGLEPWPGDQQRHLRRRWGSWAGRRGCLFNPRPIPAPTPDRSSCGSSRPFWR